MKYIVVLQLLLAAICLLLSGCESIVDQDRSDGIFHSNLSPSNTVTVDMCKNDPGWQALGYNNLGQCLRYIQSGTGVPPTGPTVSDLDGNKYPIVKIGEQWWMEENLKTTRYSDNTPIDYPGTNNDAWDANIMGAYAWYNNDYATYGSVYGALYNWSAVTTGKLCPIGWHVPSDDEWKQLEIFLGIFQNEANSHGYRGIDEGDKLKSTTGWSSPHTDATNESGFTALPGGLRWKTGSFDYSGQWGYWWSATEYSTTLAWDRELQYDRSEVGRFERDKGYGFSVRCVKD
jgi:uncharacterized protein (TIGR02145 family)